MNTQLSNRSMVGAFIGLLLAALLVITLSYQSMANDDPRNQLETQINVLLERFTSNRAEYEQDGAKLFALAEEVTKEGWDFSKVSQLVLGKHWRKVSDAQKIRFSEAFRSLLIRTYATAITKYTGDEKISFLPTEFNPKSKDRAKVHAEGKLSSGGAAIPLEFSYYRNKQDGQWKIYNVGVDGISLVTVYRSSYSDAISSRGLDALIADIEANNAKTAG